MERSDEDIIKRFNKFFNDSSKYKNKSYSGELYNFHQVIQEEHAVRTPESLYNLMEHVYVMGHEHGFNKGFNKAFEDIQNVIKELKSISKI